MVGMMARVLGTIGEDAAANDDDANDEAAVEDDDVAAEWGLQESTDKIPLKTKMIRRKSWASNW